VFLATALGAIAWQAQLVWRRPPARRTRAMWAVLACSLGANVLVAMSWAALWWRYR
jgi:hypothetical protein